MSEPKKLVINGKEVVPGKKVRLQDQGKRLHDVVPEIPLPDDVHDEPETTP